MFVLAPALNTSVPPDITPDNPFVGYNNLVAFNNIAADENAAGFPGSNLANPSTNLLWQGINTNPQSLVVTLSGMEPVDYIAIAGHNFGSQAISVTPQVSGGGNPVLDETGNPVLDESGNALLDETWSSLMAGDPLLDETGNPVLDERGNPVLGEGAFTPSDDLPLIFRFALQTAPTAVRLLLGTGNAIPQAAVLYVGQSLIFQRRVYVGHSPITMGRKTNVTNGMSESGNFLGRIKIGESRVTSVALKNLSPASYRLLMDPFIASATQYPFFFAWRPGTYPLETGFCWLTADAVPVNQLANGMMSVTLSLAGIAP